MEKKQSAVSHQLSATADYSWRGLRDSWEDCWNRVAVRAISIAKPLLQLRVLHLDHQRSSDYRERRQPPAHGKPRPHAPGQHLAQMRKVHRMAHARPNSIGDQSLLAIGALHFRQTAKLFRAEILAGSRIDEESHNQEQNRWNPQPIDSIKRNATPRSCNQCHRRPHCYPDRKQHLVGRSPPRPPATREGMDHQPERWNRRIDDAH
jgi:hypothetical protein